MTRRIKRPLREFFESKPLTDKEKTFILGCMRLQMQHAQLTNKQWAVVCQIKERYSHGQVQRREKTTERED